MNESKRILPLDGLRGIAILWVMSMHLLAPVAKAFNLKFLYESFEAGWMAVDLFFVLSGFLITRILIESKSQTSFFIPFYLRRAVRILPVLYLFLIMLMGLYGVAYLLQTKGLVTVNGPFPVEEIKSAFLFYTNFLIVHRESYIAPFLNPLWSLAIEEHFYLLWPLLIFFSSLRGIRNACILIILLSPVVRAVLHFSGFSSLPISVISFARWDGFAMGGLLATVESMRSIKVKTIFSDNFWYTLIPASLILLFAAKNNWIKESVFRFEYTALAMGFTGLIFVSLRCKKESVFHCLITQPLLLYVGKISYALYVIHMAVNMIVIRLNPGGIMNGPESLSLLINTIGIIGISIILASLSNLYLESPLRSYVKNLLEMKVKAVNGA